MADQVISHDTAPSTSQCLKVKLCKFHQTPSGCARGASCRYAHGVEELQSWPGADGSENNNKMLKFYKLKLCQFNQTPSGCARGSSCTFAHSVDELRKLHPSNHLSDDQIFSVKKNSKDSTPTDPAVLYKTKLCEFHRTPSGCARGPSCTFAHSADELRKFSPSSHHSSDDEDLTLTSNSSSLIKTKFCRFFWAPSGCIFGSNCLDAHHTSELTYGKSLCRSIVIGTRCDESTCEYYHPSTINEIVEALRNVSVLWQARAHEEREVTNYLEERLAGLSE